MSQWTDKDERRWIGKNELMGEDTFVSVDTHQVITGDDLAALTRRSREVYDLASAGCGCGCAGNDGCDRTNDHATILRLAHDVALLRRDIETLRARGVDVSGLSVVTERKMLSVSEQWCGNCDYP